MSELTHEELTERFYVLRAERDAMLHALRRTLELQDYRGQIVHGERRDYCLDAAAVKIIKEALDLHARNVTNSYRDSSLQSYNDLAASGGIVDAP